MIWFKKDIKINNTFCDKILKSAKHYEKAFVKFVHKNFLDRKVLKIGENYYKIKKYQH